MGLTIEKTVRSDHMDVLKNIVSICCQNDSKKYSFFYEEDDSYLFGHPGFFYFSDDRNNILGFICLSGIDRQNFDVCGFVLPAYRNNGIFSQLLTAVKEEYKNINLSFPLPAHCKNAAEVLRKNNFRYSDTECKMSLNLKNLIIYPSEFDIDITESGKGAQQCAFFKDDFFVGSCSITLINDSYCILSEVEIIKKYRGLGLGAHLINCLLGYLDEINIDKIILHVTKSNIPAFRLYQSMGFVVDSSLDYYCLNL